MAVKKVLELPYILGAYGVQDSSRTNVISWNGTVLARNGQHPAGIEFES